MGQAKPAPRHPLVFSALFNWALKPHPYAIALIPDQAVTQPAGSKGSRQFNAEGRPGSHGALDVDLPAMGMHELLGNREPEATMGPFAA